MPSSTAGVLWHEDQRTAIRIAESVRARDGGVHSNTEVQAWLAERRRVQALTVERLPFTDMRDWRFNESHGDLVHRTGRFFSVQGLEVVTDSGPVRHWMQPIINQPEIGILGIIVRDIGGVLHCLLQAKIEPGNINGVQLAPTVQATKSNYSRVHQGSAVPYLDRFREPRPDRVLADVLQSEQGTWFYRKRNRNMIIEVKEEVETHADFCWLTLGQLHELLLVDNLVGMDARTVLSCMPFGAGLGVDADEDGLAATVARSAEAARGSLHSTSEILSWITSRRAGHELTTSLMPLRDVEGWQRGDAEITHERGIHFSVVAVSVESNCREVGAWTQPLIQPHGLGMVALLVKRFGGVLHALINARVEPGYLGTVELAPTVQCTPENYRHLPRSSQPPFVEMIRRGRPDQILYDVELAEEGGRFLHAQTRYIVMELDEDFPPYLRPDYRWMTLHQLTGLLQHSYYINVQARTLVACLRGLQ
jgi:oxidase EvaA